MKGHVRLIAVLLMLVTACAPPAAAPGAPAPAPTAAGPQLAENQTLSFGASFIAPTLDPHLSTSGTVRRHEIFETLVLLDDNGAALPLLATDWRTVDATTWRFNMRKDSKFQDGTPLTSADVVFSWQRVSNGKIRSPIPGQMPSVADIAAVDPATVDVKTKTPDPLLPKRLYFLAIVPQAYVERVGDQEFAAKPIGSGPYKLKEFKADDRIVVEAWREHASRKPIVTQLTVRAVPDNNARQQGVRTGELDAAYSLTNDMVAGLKRDGLSVVLTPASAVNGGFLDTVGGNGVDPGPLVDKRVRQAINYAVDRDAVARTIYAGIQQPTSLLIQPGSVGYNGDLKQYTFDRAKAKQLLAEAGYPNGFKTTIGISPTAPEAQQSAIYLQSQLKEIGIETDIQTIDAPSFVQVIYKQKATPQILLGSTGTAPYYDADAFYTWFWSKNAAFGKRYDNAEFDRLLEASRVELDPAKREALLKQAGAILFDDIPWISLTTAQAIAAAKSDIAGPWHRLDVWPLVDKIYRTK